MDTPQVLSQRVQAVPDNLPRDLSWEEKIKLIAEFLSKSDFLADLPLPNFIFLFVHPYNPWLAQYATSFLITSQAPYILVAGDFYSRKRFVREIKEKIARGNACRRHLKKKNPATCFGFVEIGTTKIATSVEIARKECFSRGIPTKSAIVITPPLFLRRFTATLCRQCSGIKVFGSTLTLEKHNFSAQDVLKEFRRLQKEIQKGHCERVHIPEEVLTAASELEAALGKPR